jgi:hypothetical protein
MASSNKLEFIAHGPLHIPVVALCFILPFLLYPTTHAKPSVLPPPAVGSLTRVGSNSNEIQCYALPYGGIGFLSHLLTYWAIFCLYFGRKPLWPSSSTEYSWPDLGLGKFSLFTTVAMSIISMVHCKNAWQFVLLATLKLTLSVFLGSVAINGSFTLMKEGPRREAVRLLLKLVTWKC